MRLKVKETKAYKHDPLKGYPPLRVALKNGILAKPGMEFEAELLLGGLDDAESLLSEKPCRVVDITKKKDKTAADGDPK